MPSLNRKMAHGALWMGSLRIAVVSIGLISTIILARLLVPADFGLVAMATSILAFMQLATAFSFEIPLIQNQDADRHHFDSAWTLNVIFYSTLTVILIALAEPAAAFYQEPRLPPVIYVLAIGFLIQGFENIGIVYFQKALDFRKDFVLMLSKKILGFAITIPLAYWSRSYWALVAGMVSSNVFGVLFSYWLHPFRPRLSFKASHELLGFSKWLVLNNIVNFLRSRSPDFIIGRLSGASALGLFTISYEISTLPSTELVGPINRVAFPGYSQIARDRKRLRESYTDILRIISAIALPAGMGLAAVSIPLVDLFLGDKWSSAAPLIAILGLYGALNAIQTNTGAIFNAIGKPHLITLIGVLSMAYLITVSIILAVEYGPIGVAVAYVTLSIVMAPVTYYFVCRETSLRYRDLVGAIWQALVCSGLMYWVVRVTQLSLAEDNVGSATQLVLLISAGIVAYTLPMTLIWLIRGKPLTAEYRLLFSILQSSKARVLAFRRVH